MVGIAHLVGWVPERFLEIICSGVGIFMFDLCRLRRALILRNIKVAFPDLSDLEIVKIGRASSISLVTTFVETFWAWNHDVSSRVTVSNPEIMANALAKGQGVYLVCTHTGNFEAFASFLSRRFAKVSSPVKKVGSNAGVNKFISENRSRQGMDAFVRLKKGEGFLLIRKALQEKRIVGFMLDQARPGEPRLPLFGKPAKTNTSLGAIWERCKAPIIAGYSRRVSFGRHEITFLTDEISFTSSGDLQADVLNRAHFCNTIVEQLIKRCPEQYWWIHDRWK
jgi:KDO2-lipid IV(A) lauroyltransferase